MKEAVLSLKIPSNWISDLSEKYNASIKILDRKPYSKLGVRDLVEISVLENNLSKLLKDLQNLPSVYDIDLRITAKDKAIGTVASKCFACRSLNGSDCFLTSARSIKDGRIEWNLIFANKDSLQDLIDNLSKFGIDVKINKITEIADKRALTARQQEILQVAFDQGYFEFPRKVSVSDLAFRLKISKSTLAEILRKGESKIMEEYFRSKNK